MSPAFLLFGGYRLCDFISIERILSHSVGENCVSCRLDRHEQIKYNVVRFRKDSVQWAAKRCNCTHEDYIRKVPSDKLTIE